MIDCMFIYHVTLVKGQRKNIASFKSVISLIDYSRWRLYVVHFNA